MGKPTLNAWEICTVGFWIVEVEDFARPEAVGHVWPRRPQRSPRRGRQREDKRHPGFGHGGSAAQVSKHYHKVSYPEYIGCKKRTQGTETSKYLQERTSTETPQVVASERGPGQWHMVLKWNKLESLAVAGDSPVHVDTLYVLE
jgi:hypothetical protein